jgi:hypothetical protein
MMGRLWLLGSLLVVSLIGFGCIPKAQPGVISLWVEVPSEVRLGEPVLLKLKIRNNSIWPVNLLHGYPAHNFIVTKPDNTEIWRWAKVILDIGLTTTLKPQEQREFTGEWDQRDNQGNPVSVGTYLVQGLLHGNIFDKGGELMTKPKRLVIKP